MVKLTEKLVLARARSKSLGAVKNLNCWGSALSDITIVRKMHNIEVINASANNIESLQALSHCCNLKELYLRKNNLKNLNEVLHLKELTELRILWLSDNPFCDDISNTKYRLTVLKVLPMLAKLDNVVVTAEEVEKAKKEGDELTEPESIPEETNESKDKAIPVNCYLVNNIDNQENTESDKQEKESEESRLSPSENQYSGYNKENNHCPVDETNELRKQLGLRPLPQQQEIVTSKSTARNTQRETLGQSTASINILSATLSLVKELDEESLRTLQDAIQDRLHSIHREENMSHEENHEDMTQGVNTSHETMLAD
ncbi:cilia- and flagella-associated protein 410-like [Styela clava]